MNYDLPMKITWPFTIPGTRVASVVDLLPATPYEPIARRTANCDKRKQVFPKV